jgi:hypothetical protein
LNPFDEPGERVGPVDAKHRVLLVPVALRDTESELPPREDVDGGSELRDSDRIVVRQQAHPRGEPHVTHVFGNMGDDRLVEEVVVLAYVVFRYDHVREAAITSEFGLGDEFGADVRQGPRRRELRDE